TYNKEMTMKKLLLIAFALVISGVAQAVPPQDRAQVDEIVSQLQHFHDAGLALHKKYDYAKKDQVKQCQAAQGDLVKQAEELRERAAKLPVLAYRVNLTLAASSAVSCVSCDLDGGSCNSIPPALERVHHQLTTPVK